MRGGGVDAEVDGHQRGLGGVESGHDVGEVDAAAEQARVGDDECVGLAVVDALQGAGGSAPSSTPSRSWTMSTSSQPSRWQMRSIARSDGAA